MYFKYYLPFLFQESTSFFTFSTVILTPPKIPVFVFEIALSDTPFTYEGVSVCAVSHMQGPLAYELQEKLIPNLIGQILRKLLQKRRVKVDFCIVFVLTSVEFKYYR